MSANAAGVQERADTLNAQLQGQHDYHASLAKELADIAEIEIGQHDMHAARAFIEMAEEHAAKAGGVK
jgi:hypothetical protein